MPTRAPSLTHLDDAGRARMVAVAEKPETHRIAVAQARVRMTREAFELVRTASGAKGDAIQVARIAGIQGAKRCSELIPLCHPVRLVAVEVLAHLDDDAATVAFEVRAEAVDRTGVEMEAMTGACVAALALYDMIKAVDRAAVVEDVKLLRKSGGKSGDVRLHGAP